MAQNQSIMEGSRLGVCLFWKKFSQHCQQLWTKQALLFCFHWPNLLSHARGEVVHSKSTAHNGRTSVYSTQHKDAVSEVFLTKASPLQGKKVCTSAGHTMLHFCAAPRRHNIGRSHPGRSLLLLISVLGFLNLKDNAHSGAQFMASERM